MFVDVILDIDMIMLNRNSLCYVLFELFMLMSFIWIVYREVIIFLILCLLCILCIYVYV